MVDVVFQPLPLEATAEVEAKWATSFRGAVQSPALLLGFPDTGPLDPELEVPVAVVGGFGFRLSGVTESLAEVTGGVGELFVTSDREVDSLVALPGTLRVAAVVTDSEVVSDSAIEQNVGAVDGEVVGTAVLEGDVELRDTRRSPALVYFDGNNLIGRSTSDAALNGGTTFSAAVLFDPDLILPSADGVIAAKNNETDTQAGWKMEYVQSTGQVRVTVFTALDGSVSAQRTTNVSGGLPPRSLIAFTYDATGSADLQLYVNGASSQGVQSDTGTPGAMTNTTEPFSLGGDEPSNGGANEVRGAVYLFAAWSTALTSTQIDDLGRDGIFPSTLDSNLVALWEPAAISGNGINTNFAGWLDRESGFPLFVQGGGANVPQVIPSDTSLPLLERNDWDTDFIDTASLYPQNLNSDRALSGDNDIVRRLYDPGDTNPTVADVNDWRRTQCDVTLAIVGLKTAGTNDVLLFECYGLELRFDRPTQTWTAVLGADSTGSGNPNTAVTFDVDGGMGEDLPFNVVFRYNALEDAATLFVSGQKYLGNSTAGTNDFTDRTGLELCDQADWARTIVIPACLSDQQVATLQGEYQPTVYSFDRPELRFAPQVEAFGLAGAVDYDIDDPFRNDTVYVGDALATGELTLSGQPSDGDQFTVGDGTNPVVTFEFDSDASVVETATLRRVVIGADVTATLQNLRTAVNNTPALDVTASYASGDTVDLVADDPQVDGEDSVNVPITAPVNVSANLSFDGMSGGTAIDPNTIPQRAILLPSVHDSFSRPDWQYVETPYPVQEPVEDDGDEVDEVIFGDPLPTVVSVTVDDNFNITATANAGPTDAGQVLTWWEIELVTNDTTVVVQAAYNPTNNFSINRNDVSSFSIPLGQDWEDLRIRFVIIAAADATQSWQSLYTRMEGEGFDNGEVETVTTPGVEQPAPPTVDDLQVSVVEQAQVAAAEVAASRFTVRLDPQSRYKTTAVFQDSSREDGPEFDLLSRLDEFAQLGTEYQVYRVTDADVGFLDRIAVRFYGPGSEGLWWVIAYANAIVDPESLRPGDALLIPSRARVREYVALRPAR